jgi:putative transposase
MGRVPRLQVCDATYHVTARGVGPSAIFTDDVDRVGFLEILAKVIERCRWVLHAYCLMTTHYHAIVRTPAGNLAEGMCRLNGDYARTFNRRHGRQGHLFGKRYYDVLVQTQEHLHELARYVSLNPVRAGMCGHPAQWRWSSYRAAAGLVPAPPFLSSDWLLAQFGSTRARAPDRFREFVEDGIAAARWPETVPGAVSNTVPGAVNIMVPGTVSNTVPGTEVDYEGAATST